MYIGESKIIILITILFPQMLTKQTRKRIQETASERISFNLEETATTNELASADQGSGAEMHGTRPMAFTIHVQREIVYKQT